MEPWLHARASISTLKMLRPVVPSGGGPLLQAYRNLYQECWHPLRDERPRLEEVTRRINDITDDMFELVMLL